MFDLEEIVMANIKQQKKRVLTNEKRRQVNASYKSSLKTAFKAVELKVKEGNKEEALVALNFANKKLDKAQAKGIVHKNYVARNKSRLASLVNSL